MGGGATGTRNGYATASQCCTSSPYSFVVTAAPGRYTLVVGVADQSDGEGASTAVSREVTVR